ncbi:hypothetical protein DPMN_055852 [Dreissena polymorpha]|uniref:Uncharacterized protein n=1 Tax=Dreissena polymorpha TaxID=45954 RepID=A0A9D4CQP2_DREPO|nr:hypothetical protein DPMN_055852 [Dreissena polymorpha]
MKSLERLVERSQSTAPRVQTLTRPIPVVQHLQAIQDGNLSTEVGFLCMQWHYTRILFLKERPV